MPTGTHRPDRPQKANHAANFDRALQDALDKWTQQDGTNVSIRFEATVSANPGISEYRVIIS